MLLLGIRFVQAGQHQQHRPRGGCLADDAQRAEDERRLAAGNRGYLVRDGVTTLRSATKLQVRVLDPQPQ